MSKAKQSIIKANSSLAKHSTDDINNFLTNYKGQIARALPEHLTADRLMQIATTVVATNPKLKECQAASLIGAVLQSASLGFDPTPTLGYCYFVPYKGRNDSIAKIQLQIGYKGYMELARRSNQISEIYAHCVYSDDEFEYRYGLNKDLVHIPKTTKKEDSAITHVYAVAKLKDGGVQFVVLDKYDIEDLRLRSPFQKAGAKVGAWKTDYPKMAKAKAIKQLSSYLPLETAIRVAIASDEQVITPEQINKGEYLAETAEYVDEDTGEITEEDATNQKAKAILGEDVEEVEYEEMPND